MARGADRTDRALAFQVIGRIRTPFLQGSGTPIQPPYAKGIEGRFVPVPEEER
jgi:hypothetical protein